MQLQSHQMKNILLHYHHLLFIKHLAYYIYLNLAIRNYSISFINEHSLFPDSKLIYFLLHLQMQIHFALVPTKALINLLSLLLHSRSQLEYLITFLPFLSFFLKFNHVILEMFQIFQFLFRHLLLQLLSFFKLIYYLLNLFFRFFLFFVLYLKVFSFLSSIDINLNQLP